MKIVACDARKLEDRRWLKDWTDFHDILAENKPHQMQAFEPKF